MRISDWSSDVCSSDLLDVVGHAFAPHFLLDQLLHGAQRFDGRKIQVTAINDRAQHVEQLRTGHLVTRHHPRLDHRAALPVAPMILLLLIKSVTLYKTE